MSQSTHSIISSDGKTSENKSLEVIKEELSIPLPSSTPMLTSKYTAEQCICKKTEDEFSQVRISPTHVEEILKQKEKELREEYDRILQREKEQIKEKFNFILLNEQTRASYMLREAHRERQEKINALQTQLQCKNLAALMYVMCTERKRSRFEKLQIVEDYTNYINTLHDILVKGQELILHLSRGYKTAARVDHEWREKMKKVVSQFLAFIYHFAGGDPETNQYLIDLPKLLKTETSLDIDPNEDPCDCDDDDDEDKELDELAAKSLPHTVEKEWWQDLDSEERPFVMFGDMADFQPNQRREVLKNIKAQKIRAKKTAPKEWKKLSFKDMFEHSKCVHLDKIKSMYKDRLPVPIKWECLHSPGNGELRVNSKLSIPNTNRTASLDIRGTMGSILKIITSGPGTAPVPAKTELLGARDSIEITSMTRLSVKKAKSDTRKSDTGKSDTHHHPEANVTLNIGKKRASVFVENGDDVDSLLEIPKHVSVTTPSLSKTKDEDEINDGTVSLLGSLHTDSLTVIQSRHPAETDHLINYEKVCPMEKCQHMQVDAFMRSLPPYMTANPFTHFQQNFEEYETCTPEQLEMLKQRTENKMKKESANEIKKEESGSGRESPLTEWFSTGVAVQTSDVDIMPPCICHKTPPKSPDPKDLVLNLAELDLVKLAMDAIHREFMFDDRIEFDRFKLIGKDTDSREPKHEHLPDEEFKESRYYEIADILKKHPSMLDIFQANAK